jgi:hypothetical protein
MYTDKLDYIYNHISVIDERMEIVKENLKWISSDVKFIKKLSKPKEDTLSLHSSQ